MYKTKIAKSMSYPLGAEALSLALADVPQIGTISLRFGPSVHKTSLRPGHATRYKVLSGVYRCHSTNQFGPASGVLQDYNERHWEIVIHEVPRGYRHAVSALLRDQGLPRLREWFRQHASIQGQEGSCEIDFTFDETQVSLECTSNHQLDPEVRR